MNHFLLTAFLTTIIWAFGLGWFVMRPKVTVLAKAWVFPCYFFIWVILTLFLLMVDALDASWDVLRESPRFWTGYWKDR
jgi:hypothetical protein